MFAWSSISTSNPRKENLTATICVNKANGISNHLTDAIEPISDHDLLLYIIDGLGSEYISFISCMNMRETRSS